MGTSLKAYINSTDYRLCSKKGCSTNGGSKPYEPCVFPFIWNDVYYYGCTGVDNGGVPWCATQTVNDLYVSGYWGNCEEGCPGGSGNCIQLPVIQNS